MQVGTFSRTEINLTVYVLKSVDRSVYIYDKHRMMDKLVDKGQFCCYSTQLFDDILLKFIFCSVIPYKVYIIYIIHRAYIIYIAMPQLSIF